MDKSERDKKFGTVSIRDEKTNKNDNEGDNPTEFLSGDKKRDNPEVWGSEARMVDNYKGRMPVVYGLSHMIVEYCGYRDDENGTGKNRTQSLSSLSTVRSYVTASRGALRSCLSGGRDGIYNNENRNLTMTSTSTNTSDDVADWTERTVRDAQKKIEEET